MKKIFFVILFLIAFLGNSFCQEIITGLQVNPLVKSNKLSSKPQLKKAGDTIRTLPFYDDFSYKSVYPADSLWKDKYTFVNNTYCIHPPSLGVATFDAIDDTGALYSDANFTPFVADFLTSQIIRLDSSFNPPHKLVPGDSVYLSFYYQPQGFANYPNPWDSLVCEISSFPPDTTFITDTSQHPPVTDTILSTHWNRAWSSKGMTYGSFNPSHKRFFKQVMIPIKDSKYFYKDFQIRFYNYASIANDIEPSWQSNMDIWNLDYVYIDQTRNKQDTAYLDASITRPSQSMLKNYSQMPIDHFSNSDLGSFFHLDTSIYSLNSPSLNYNIYYEYTVSETGGSFTFSHTGGVADVLGQTYDTAAAHIKPAVDFTLPTPLAGDTASFVLKHFIRLTGGAVDWNKANDTITYVQNFNNFFAYDDGTAEAGYGLAGLYSKLAYRFDINKPDTLGAVQIYFNRTLSSANSRYFKLTVWSSIDPEIILYQSPRVKPYYEDDINKFHTFYINTVIPVSGTFYVGWQQASEGNLNIGYDMNNNSQSKISYNCNGEWVTTSFTGSLMIRPVLELTPQQKKMIEDTKAVNNFSCFLYPNPLYENQAINIEIPEKYQNPEYKNTITIDVYNSIGKKVFSTPYDEKITFTDLAKDLYIININCLKTGEQYIGKFIITQ